MSGGNSGELITFNPAELSPEVLERKLLDLPQADCPVTHIFGPGLYIRELRMAAGTLALGHHQKLPHMNNFISGKVRIVNEDGSTKDLVAPMTFMAGPGRKFGYVLEDVIWQNIYPTNETDIGKLEETYLDKSEYSRQYTQRLITNNVEDVADYKALLVDLGISEEFVREETETLEDQIPMPVGAWKCRVDDSGIEGKGLFATAGIAEGEIIAPALIDGKRTPVGRYTNHSKTPNAGMIKMDSGDIILVALFNINGCRGGEVGEEITIDYRQATRVAFKKVGELCQE